MKRFGFTRQKSMSHIQVQCHFNQDYSGPLELLSHFDYLQYQYFNESMNEKVFLPNIDAVYLDLVVAAKRFQNPFRQADCFSLLESFGVAVYLAESKVMEEIIGELISRRAPVTFLLQIFLFKQDFDLPTFETFPLYDYLEFYFDDVVSSREWLDFTLQNVRLFVNKRNLRVTNEETVLLGIRNWIEHNLKYSENAYDDAYDNAFRTKTIQELSHYICEPSLDYFRSNWNSEVRLSQNSCHSNFYSLDERYIDGSYLWEWLRDELEEHTHLPNQFNSLRRDQFSLRHNFDSPEPTFFIGSRPKPDPYGLRSDDIDREYIIGKFNHVPFTTGNEPEVICKLDEKHNPGLHGHLVPYFTSNYGVCLVVFGGNLGMNAFIYIVSIDKWFALPDCPRPISEAGVHIIQNYIYIVAGYGPHLEMEMPKNSLNQRHDIIQLRIRTDNDVTCPNPFHVSDWKSFECSDIARFHLENPCQKITLANWSLLTLRAEAKKKKIIRKKFGISSNNLLIMGKKYFQLG